MKSQQRCNPSKPRKSQASIKPCKPIKDSSKRESSRKRSSSNWRKSSGRRSSSRCEYSRRKNSRNSSCNIKRSSGAVTASKRNSSSKLSECCRKQRSPSNHRSRGRSSSKSRQRGKSRHSHSSRSKRRSSSKTCVYPRKRSIHELKKESRHRRKSTSKSKERRYNKEKLNYSKLKSQKVTCSPTGKDRDCQEKLEKTASFTIAKPRLSDFAKNQVELLSLCPRKDFAANNKDTKEISDLKKKAKKRDKCSERTKLKQRSGAPEPVDVCNQSSKLKPVFCEKDSALKPPKNASKMSRKLWRKPKRIVMKSVRSNTSNCDCQLKPCSHSFKPKLKQKSVTVASTLVKPEINEACLLKAKTSDISSKRNDFPSKPKKKPSPRLSAEILKLSNIHNFIPYVTSKCPLKFCPDCNHLLPPHPALIGDNSSKSTRVPWKSKNSAFSLDMKIRKRKQKPGSKKAFNYCSCSPISAALKNSCSFTPGKTITANLARPSFQERVEKAACKQEKEGKVDRAKVGKLISRQERGSKKQEKVHSRSDKSSNRSDKLNKKYRSATSITDILSNRSSHLASTSTSAISVKRSVFHKLGKPTVSTPSMVQQQLRLLHAQQERLLSQPTNQARNISNPKGAYSGCSSMIEHNVNCLCRGKSSVQSLSGFNKPDNTEKCGEGDKVFNASILQRDCKYSPTRSESRKNVKSGLKSHAPVPPITPTVRKNENIPKRKKPACLMYMVQCLMPLCKLPMNSSQTNSISVKPPDPSRRPSARFKRNASRHLQKKKSNALNISLPKHSNMKISIQMLPKPKPSFSLLHRPRNQSNTSETIPKKSVCNLNADLSFHEKLSSLLQRCKKSASHISSCPGKSNSNIKSLSSKKLCGNVKSNCNTKLSKCKNDSNANRSSCIPCLNPCAPRKSLSPCNMPVTSVGPECFSNSFGQAHEIIRNSFENKTDIHKKEPCEDSSVKSAESKVSDPLKDQPKNLCKDIKTETCTPEAATLSDSLKISDQICKNKNVGTRKMSKSKFTGKSKINPPPACPPEEKDVYVCNSTVKPQRSTNSCTSQNLINSKPKKSFESNWAKTKKNLQCLNQILEVNENAETHNQKFSECFQPCEPHPGHDVIRRSTYTVLKHETPPLNISQTCVGAPCNVHCKPYNKGKYPKNHKPNFIQNFSLSNIQKNSCSSNCNQSCKPRTSAKSHSFNCSQRQSAEKFEIHDSKYSKLQTELSILCNAVNELSKPAADCKPQNDSKVAITEKFMEKMEQTIKKENNERSLTSIKSNPSLSSEKKINDPTNPSTNTNQPSVCCLKQASNLFFNKVSKVLPVTCGFQRF